MAITRGKSKDKARITPREIEALDLRKRGLSYRAIGAKLGISHEQARQDVDAELKRLAEARQDKAEELRELELERLDTLQSGLEAMAAVGNPGAVASMLKVMERRARLLGLDAPAKADITTGGERLTLPTIFLPEVDDDSAE